MRSQFFVDNHVIRFKRSDASFSCSKTLFYSNIFGNQGVNTSNLSFKLLNTNFISNDDFELRNFIPKFFYITGSSCWGTKITSDDSRMVFNHHGNSFSAFYIGCGLNRGHKIRAIQLYVRSPFIHDHCTIYCSLSLLFFFRLHNLRKLGYQIA